MGTIYPNSYAAGIGVGMDNKSFSPSVELLERKHLIVASYDPAILTIVDNVPARVSSPAEVAATYGAGFPAHRMALAAAKANGGAFAVPTYILPNPEDGGATAATGTVVFGVGPATTAETMAIYIGGDKVSFDVAVGDTVTNIGDAFEVAVNADEDLPVTALNAAGTVTLTAKCAGTWGNDVSTTMGWGTEEIAGAVTVTITQVGDVIAGVTDPDYDDALAGLGTGDSANSDGYTDVNFSYGFDDADCISAVSTYVGVGSGLVGLYSPTIGRPFRNLWGDTVAKAAGLTALEAITDVHLDDRASGVLAAPGSPSHPHEIAAQAMHAAAKLNASRAEQSTLNVVLVDVKPGLDEDRWSTEYANRDLAVKAGIGTTMEKGGQLVIQNLLSMYRPASVPIASNGYRSMRNISITQNILNSIKVNFENDKWSGCSIVEDVAKVGNALDRAKARDIGSVIDDMLALVDGFYSRAWIYSADWTKSQLAAGGLVTIRAGANGFDTTLPLLYSGEAGIFNTAVEFDTSLAVLL